MRRLLPSLFASVLLLSGCVAEMDDPGFDENDPDEPNLDELDDDEVFPEDLLPAPEEPRSDLIATGGPTFSVFFSVPKMDNSANQRDYTLETQLKSLLTHTPAGAQVRVSLYQWSRSTMADAFIAAARRGVDVQVVLDGSNKDRVAVDKLRAGLGAGKVTLCTARDACIGTGINHNKFFLFSKLDDGSTNVVVQSSANLTAGQLSEHNNMVVIRNDPKLYAGYRAYWNDLHAHRQNLNYYDTVNGTHAVKAYFFPRNVGGDTVVNVLDNITSCRNTKVRVAMAFFANNRSAVADALARQARRGCDVRVVVRENEDTGSTIVGRMRRGGVKVERYKMHANGEGVHSKYLLIEGEYLGNRRKIVWTGSHNYTGGALRTNDETLIKITNNAVYDKFAANWTAINRRAAVD